MSATILPFRPLTARKRSDGATQQGITDAQSLGAGTAPPQTGAVSFTQDWADRNLEVAIDRAHWAVMNTTGDEQLEWFERMKRLCALRSQTQIERMERAKGLR